MSIPSAPLRRTAALCMALTVTLAAVGGTAAKDRQEDPAHPAPAGLSLTADTTTTTNSGYFSGYRPQFYIRTMDD